MPMAEALRVAASVREPLEWEAVAVMQGEGEREEVMEALRDWLGQGEGVKEGLGVEVIEGERVPVLETLLERVTEGVMEEEGEAEFFMLAVKVAEGLRERLWVREGLRVTQEVGEAEEERHSVGVSEGLGETEPVRDGEELTE